MRNFDFGRVLLAVTMDARASRSTSDLRKKLKEDEEALQELLDIADDDLTDEDQEEIQALTNAIKSGRAKLARNAAAGLLDGGKEDTKTKRASKPKNGRRRDDEDEDDEEEEKKPATTRRRETIAGTVRNQDDDRRHGFRNFGDFASMVGRGYKQHDTSALERLTNAATTFGTESVGGDGGWLVPPEFSDAIWKKVNGEGSLLELCQPFETSRNSFAFPKDETTPWDNSNGIKVFWEGEGETFTESKPKFEIGTARLNKLVALVKVTEELLEDAPGLDSYLRAWTPIRMQARINTAIIRGNGVGKPLGILNASSLITVTKETSQDAATIIMPNIEHIWQRLYSPLRNTAVWLVNQECESMLNGMAFVPSAPAPGAGLNGMTAYAPVYLPNGSIAGQPNATLKGRPVIFTQACSQLGTVGDIILTDLKQYMALRKAQAQGIQVDTSIHLHFDQAVDTYRFMFRMTGQPMWTSTIAAENGSATYGWAVTIETRS